MAYKIKNPKVKEKKVPYEIRTYKVYSFENAPPELKEKILGNYRYFNVEDINLLEQDDYIIDLGLKKETQKKVKSGNALFSWTTGYYNVDYGYKYVQFKDLKVNNDEAFREELGVSKKLWNKVDYSFENPSREGNTQISFSLKDGGDTYALPKKEQEELDEAIDHFNYLMKEANKNLEKDYEYQTSDEAVKESLIANEYKFNEHGKID